MSANPSASVQDLIDARPIGVYQLATVVLIFSVILVDGYDLLVMATAVPAMSSQWHIPASSFGYALSAVNIGLAVGAMCTAPLADHLGRKPVILGGLMCVGLSSLATASADSLSALFLWRLLTGAGLGTCFSGAFALLVDLIPRRRKAFFAALHGCNTSLGASIGGFLAPEVLSNYGWHGVFVVGGLLPLVVWVPAYLLLPESPSVLASKPQGRQRLEAILRRIGVTDIPERLRVDTIASSAATRITALLRPEYRTRTFLLWVLFSINSFALYYLSGWLPTLLQNAGLPPAQALRAASFLWMGGIAGAASISWLIDHGWPRVGLIGALLTAAVVLTSMLVVPVSFAIWGGMIFLLGASISGVQFALPGVSALLYPSAILATGNGWAVSIARIGAISGPIVGGQLLAWALPATTELGVLAIPAVLGAGVAAALFANWRTRPATIEPARVQLTPN